MLLGCRTNKFELVEVNALPELTIFMVAVLKLKVKALHIDCKVLHWVSASIKEFIAKTQGFTLLVPH